MTDEQAIIKLGLKTGAGSSHGKSVQATVRFVIQPVLHSVYDSLDRLATRGPIDNISLPVHSVPVPPLFHLRRGATSTASSLLLHGLPSEVSCSPAVVVSK